MKSKNITCRVIEPVNFHKIYHPGWTISAPYDGNNLEMLIKQGEVRIFGRYKYLVHKNLQFENKNYYPDEIIESDHNSFLQAMLEQQKIEIIERISS